VKVLVTGAAGFLGRGLILHLESKHELRLMDVVDFETPHEKVLGSAADLATCRRAVQGCQALVIAHMAPWGEGGGNYKTPALPFDVNVKGTANLFCAAVEAGIKQVVLVSSIASVGGTGGGQAFFSRDLPLKPSAKFSTMYSLSKACQELIAELYHREHQMNVAVLRVGYILSAEDGGRVVDKYGREIHIRHPQNTERRDIGLAALLALDVPDLGYEVFYVVSTPEGDTKFDVAYTRQRLGWKPQHDFSWLPLEQKA
jgi:nucleoside-diphosphate-sugar epimerase